MNFRARAGCLLWGLLGVFGCNPDDFDSISQLSGLRVLGVMKDKPYARPGDRVTLRMLYHDTGTPGAGSDETPGSQRPISIAWISGCENPPGDSFELCFETLRKLGERAAGGDGGVPDAGPAVSLSAGQVQFGGVTFEVRLPSDIIEGHGAPPDPKVPRYGLAYVFFAACAGELRLAAEGDGFPLACHDEAGARLGSRDFVVGYSAIYAYAQITNPNPRILGMSVGGKRLDAAQVCIGAACDVETPDPERPCETDRDVALCSDPDQPGDCPKLSLQVMVDPDSVNDDAVLTASQGSPVKEQMWVNYHTDNGEFIHDVSLVNDVTSGFQADPEAEFIATGRRGATWVWAVVRDNRGGTSWARAELCVK